MLGIGIGIYDGRHSSLYSNHVRAFYQLDRFDDVIIECRPHITTPVTESILFETKLSGFW